MCMPTRDEFERFVKEHYQWRALDRALYDLCNPNWCPDVNLYDRIRSSVEGVGRGYGALTGHGDSVEPITRALWKLANGTPGAWPIIMTEHLPASPWLTQAGVQESINVHHALCTLLRPQIGWGPCVFVAKWLHFHRPGVPLFDNDAKEALNGMKVDPADDVSAPPGLDHDNVYPDFCRKLLTFARHLGPPPGTAREIDVYLWCKGKQLPKCKHEQEDH